MCQEFRKSIEACMSEQGRAGKLVGGEAFETEQMGLFAATAPVRLR